MPGFTQESEHDGMAMATRHETMGETRLESDVKITRHRGPIDLAAAQLYDAIFSKFFTPQAFVGLSALTDYAALRDRAAEMDADLRRLELDRQTAELEQQRLLASKVGGEQLASALSVAEEKQRAASQRLQQTQLGSRTFHARLAKARADAAEAIRGRFNTVLASMMANHAAKDAEQRQKLAAAIGPFLNELAALEQAGVELGIHRDLEPRIDRLLAMVPAAGKH